MRRDQMARRSVSLENGELLTLDYWLLTEEGAAGERFGLAVTDSMGEEIVLSDITNSRPYAIELLYRLAVGKVTTVSAKEIVIDLLSDERHK